MSLWTASREQPYRFGLVIQCEATLPVQKLFTAEDAEHAEDQKDQVSFGPLHANNLTGSAWVIQCGQP